MKKLCYSAFIAFWASLATFYGLHVLAENDPPQAASKKTTYSLQDVEQHKTKADCWMAIEGKVYNLSTYIDKHPTPPALVEAWCGKEATEGMQTKGYGNTHSEFAWGMLAEYYIGDLEK